MKKVNCETGLKKDVISKEVFDREVALCKEMGEKEGSCCWGKCIKCGVVPLLNKLYNGEVVEDKKEVEGLKRDLINM